MASLQPGPEPKSLLAYHRILSPSAGVKVSPLCLGAMNFGTQWEGMMGKCDKETSYSILDYFVEQGGNFIDTANTYQEEESEIWLGEWMEERKNRDQMVIATKYTTGYRGLHRGSEILSNSVGNSAKSMHVSVNASLRKLKTDYIDLLYVHWWDFTSSVEEVMRALNVLVTSGKVLYLGISDTPAWVVVKANAYARQHGLTPFSVYQGRWSASLRDMEREIIPACQSEGMGFCPWGTLGQGSFKTEEQRKANASEGRQGRPPSENDIKVSKVLEEIASTKGTEITSVALAYIFHKIPNVFPIVGGRKIDHLKGNISALGVNLTKQDIEHIEDAAEFDPGFPMNFIFRGSKYSLDLDASDVGLTKAAVYLDVPSGPKPVPARSK